jgi:hypothetical protein
VASPPLFNFNQPFGAPGGLGLHQPPGPHFGDGLAYPPPPFADEIPPTPLLSAGTASFGSFPPVVASAPPPRPSISEAVRRHEALLQEPYDPPIDVEMGSGDEYLGDSEDEEEAAIERRGENQYSAYVRGPIVEPREASEAVMRTFSAYAEGKALTTYQPTVSNSPLNDPKTLAIFRHFVFVTGPSMSLYERHPFDHSKIHPAETAQAGQGSQNIWTCE